MKKEKRNSKGKKSVFLMLLAVLLLTITIGFATLSATLNINGTSKIKGNTWQIDVPDDDDIVCPQGQVCTINQMMENLNVQILTIKLHVLIQ